MPGTSAAHNVEAVRSVLSAVRDGDIDALADLLADDVRWHAAGDDGGGCQNREQAMVWIGETIARGVRAEVLDVRALDEDRVLVLLQRNLRRDGDPTAETPTPHGQIVTFRDGRVSEIVVYASDDDAIDAARKR